MKVLAFIVVATFFVLRASATTPSIDEKARWGIQCYNETGYTGSESEDKTQASCFVACYLEKAGSMKDGKLGEREKVVSYLAQEWTLLGAQAKEGRTLRQLAEQCYDEANAKTEKCEIGGAVAECGRGGMQNRADTSDKSSEETKESTE